MLDDRRQDLVTEGVDVALRFGTLADSSATLSSSQDLASRAGRRADYLGTAPAADRPADLAAHAVIVGPQGVGDWSFRKAGTTASVRIEGRLKIPVLEGA